MDLVNLVNLVINNIFMRRGYLFILSAVYTLLFLNMKTDEIATITKGEQITPNRGKIVRIVGIYRELNVAKAPDQTLYTGRVYIELEDGGMIALDRDKDGIRSKKEIEEHRNKKVIVNGLLLDRLPLWGDGSEASITMPFAMAAYVMSEEAEILLKKETENIPTEEFDILPIITKKEEVTSNENKTVSLIGTYKKLYLPIKKKRPGEKKPKKEFSGRICIELDDHTEVAVEINDKGLRPSEEIKKFENKKVVVIGTLYKNHVLFDGPENMNVTCIKNIESIELKNDD